MSEPGKVTTLVTPEGEVTDAVVILQIRVRAEVFELPVKLSVLMQVMGNLIPLLGTAVGLREHWEANGTHECDGDGMGCPYRDIFESYLNVSRETSGLMEMLTGEAARPDAATLEKLNFQDIGQRRVRELLRYSGARRPGVD